MHAAARRNNFEIDDRLSTPRGLGPKRSMDDDTKRKMYIGAGIAAATLAAIGGLILVTRPAKAAKPPNIGLIVKPQCSGYTITDMMILRDQLRKELRKEVKVESPDPFTVTKRFLSQKRFGCVVYPNQTRNPGEADLFATIFVLVTELMEQERLLSGTQRQTFDTMVTTWAASQGASPRGDDRADRGGIVEDEF